jgi:hypothetical protein
MSETKIIKFIEPQPVGSNREFGAEESRCEDDHDRYEKLQNAGIDVVPFNKELCGGGSAKCVMHGKLGTRLPTSSVTQKLPTSPQPLRKR